MLFAVVAGMMIGILSSWERIVCEEYCSRRQAKGMKPRGNIQNFAQKLHTKSENTFTPS
jgi:hypothetical protein